MYSISDLNNISDMVRNELLQEHFPNNWRELQIIVSLNKILLLIEFYDKNKNTNNIDIRIQTLLMNCELEYNQD